MKSAFYIIAFAAINAFCLELSNIVAPVDGTEFFENPGCGFAGGAWSDLKPGMPTNGLDLCAKTPNCTKLWAMHKFSKGYVYKTPEYYTNHVMRFVGGADIPLDENALLSVSNSLLKCRLNGGTCIPRFAYTWDQWGGVEPDDFDILLTHIRQLSAVLSQFRDVVPAVECGIIGAWGEMHTSRYGAKEYQNQIVKAWLDGLPKDMSLLGRSSYVWMAFLDTSATNFFNGGMETFDQALLARMGFYNDGYLGTDWDYGTWGGGTGIWSRRQGQTFLRERAVPYGGEFAWVSTNYFDKNVHLLDTNRFNIVQEWYDTHLSYLRNIRDTRMGVTRRLADTPFSSAKWAFDGMPRLSEYDGIDLRKFCEDHMGYRYVVRGVKLAAMTEVDSPGGPRSRAAATVMLDLEIENTGFGQLLFAEKPEVLLTSSGASTANAVLAPAKMSATIASIRGGATTHVTLTFPYPADAKPGEFGVWLRIRVPLVDEPADSTPRRTIRFANKDCWHPDIKANYLFTLRLP
jgi:hypothetical protein